MGKLLLPQPMIKSPQVRPLPLAQRPAPGQPGEVQRGLQLRALGCGKRLVESGQHVFMLLDSITRMGRAFNNAHKGGATMSGGVGVGALEMPRRLFAAARNTREAAANG